MNTQRALDNLTEMILQKKLLLFSELSITSLDELIATRDSEQFETKWLEVFQPIEEEASGISEEDTEAIDRLREASFKAAYSATENADFAAFVSDDFELIGRAVVLGKSEPWLNGLWLEYKADNFPAGQLPSVEGELATLIT